jgi:hypothetical protein
VAAGGKRRRETLGEVVWHGGSERERKKQRASSLTSLRCSCAGCSMAGSSDAAARRAPELGNGSGGASSWVLGF